MRSINPTVLREALRSAWIDHPDDSHGEPYVNRGIQSALRIVADLVGDIDFTAPCEAEDDPRKIGERNWCRTHFAQMGSRWHCDLAATPWLWRPVSQSPSKSRPSGDEGSGVVS